MNADKDHPQADGSRQPVRPVWLLPVSAVAAVLLLVGGTVAITLAVTSDDHQAAASSASNQEDNAASTNRKSPSEVCADVVKMAARADLDESLSGGSGNPGYQALVREFGNSSSIPMIEVNLTAKARLAALEHGEDAGLEVIDSEATAPCEDPAGGGSTSDGSSTVDDADTTGEDDYSGTDYYPDSGSTEEGESPDESGYSYRSSSDPGNSDSAPSDQDELDPATFGDDGCADPSGC